MSNTNGINGEHPRRTRTPAREPSAAGAENVPPGPADRSTGGTEGQGVPPSSPVSNGRDNLGRFGAGNAHGKGHAGHKRMAELRGAVLEAATPEVVSAITKKLAMLALQEGDVAAARLVLEYSCGKPIQGIELSGPEGEPLARSAELSTALGAALSPFSEEVRFAVLGVIKRAVDAGRAE